MMSYQFRQKLHLASCWLPRKLFILANDYNFSVFISLGNYGRLWGMDGVMEEGIVFGMGIRDVGGVGV